jgi:hypothetical protein
MTSTVKVNTLTVATGCTMTLGESGKTVALASGASQTGFGRTGTVDWITTPKTATFTAVSGEGYFCNTTSTAFTVNLPAGVAGAIVSLADYAATWQTNNVTVTPNGTDKIGSLNENATLNTEGQSVTFVYVDSTQGWINTMDSTSNVRGAPPFIAATGGTILTCGNFKTHIFTGPGTFTVTNAGGISGSNSVEYVVVAAGGGGGGFAGGGGGAGGFRQNFPSPTTAGLPVSAQGYPITVGSGGAGSGSGGPVGCQINQTSGNPAVFSTITSTGGGRGATNDISGSTPDCSTTSGRRGLPGGSGGGGSRITSPANNGTGNTPPVSPPQGNDGGTGTNSDPYNGGGGGGAAAVGTNATSPTAGSGGDGSPIATTFFGPTSSSYGTPGPASGRYFAGGGGAGQQGSGTAGTGGAGGGGAGSNSGAGTNGTANTGGGAGAGGNPTSAPTNGGGGTGGSGIVMIRYKFQ